MISLLLLRTLRRNAVWLLLAACLETGFAGTALAQNAFFESRERDYPQANFSAIDAKSLTALQGWRQDLEKSGVLSRTGPFRVALPLAQFGENGPMLNFTYVPKTAVASGVYMLFLRINID